MVQSSVVVQWPLWSARNLFRVSRVELGLAVTLEKNEVRFLGRPDSLTRTYTSQSLQGHQINFGSIMVKKKKMKGLMHRKVATVQSQTVSMEWSSLPFYLTRQQGLAICRDRGRPFLKKPLRGLSTNIKLQSSHRKAAIEKLPLTGLEQTLVQYWWSDAIALFWLVHGIDQWKVVIAQHPLHGKKLTNHLKGFQLTPFFLWGFVFLVSSATSVSLSSSHLIFVTRSWSFC